MCRMLVMDAFLERVSPLVRRTQMEAEVIERTGWSVSDLDACPPGRLERYLLYWNAKSEREREQIEEAKEKSGH